MSGEGAWYSCLGKPCRMQIRVGGKCPAPCPVPAMLQVLRQGRTWDAFHAGPGGGCTARWAARLKKCVCEGLGMCLGEM